MKIKKSLRILLGIALIYVIVPFVNAQFGGFDLKYILWKGPQDLIQIIKDFTSPFFEVLLNTTAYEPFFFAKVLFLILLYVMIYFILQKSKFLGLEENKGVLFVISATISILAMRYLPKNEFTLGMLLPYGTLGIALITFLPFLIYFFFVHRGVQGTFGRRAAWAVYALVFLVLWRLRSSELSLSSNWVYTSGLILVILAFIFDPAIHRYFGYAEFAEYKRESAIRRKIDLMDELSKVNRLLEEHPKDKHLQKRKEDLERALEEVQKEL